MSNAAPNADNSPARSLQAAERRAWIRYRPRSPEVFWQMFGAKDTELFAAQVLNLSARGIGLALDRAVVAGNVLVLKFGKDTLNARPHLVRIKHVTNLADGTFKVGATFVVPLGDEQLRALVD
jgi:hypothetical protein